MDFDLPEEHRMFQKAARDFAEKEIAPLVDEAEKNEKTPVEIYPKMGQLGYLCPSYPEELGGGGLGKLGDCILYEEIARICSGICAGIMIHGGLGTSSIYKHGTKKQIQEYLIPAIKGEKISGFGLTEPNAGSDAAAMETTAVLKGEHYVLNGTKMFITNSPFADFILIAAYTDKKKGPGGGVSQFIVERGTPGFTVNKLKKLPVHSAETAEIIMDECRIPKENLIGEEGKGFHYVMEGLAGGRIVHAAHSVGIAKAAFEASLEYAKTRVQFGKPIGNFQAIAFKIARMALDIESARSLTYRSAWLIDQGRECNTEAAMTKLFASEACNRVTTDAMQVHGGYAFVMDSPVQRYFRDARVRTVTEGSTEVQLTLIARSLGLKPS
ncbi:MAG: acyl-CoA dehydrogenase family protein [Dehalococcoidia bacterium]